MELALIIGGALLLLYVARGSATPPTGPTQLPPPSGGAGQGGANVGRAGGTGTAYSPPPAGYRSVYTASGGPGSTTRNGQGSF